MSKLVLATVLGFVLGVLTCGGMKTAKPCVRITKDKLQGPISDGSYFYCKDEP
jgi:hypothetical protein